ncbi:hypothetical protein EB796_014051 [Bugula neritina]|uniref:Uncharacterized protein n=1 Tax=Bugula neritina TaxID=10212 RepID=A0A7J7JMT6_BUGNE|nr:hypothetical protein EB796_014051 [Bugula neritina]
MAFHAKKAKTSEGFRKILTHLKMDTIKPLAAIDTIYRIKQNIEKGTFHEVNRATSLTKLKTKLILKRFVGA